jgi:amidohydrolase
MSIENWQELLFKTVEKLAPEVYELNDFLADNPELSGQEHESARAISRLLESYEMEVEMPFAGLPTAFKTGFKGGGGSKKLALLVEYDALPGIGHACGHNVSGSISILTGLALSKHLEALTGRVDIIGTPDEEVNGGKIVMGDQGFFDDYDLALMIHLDNKNRINAKFLALDGLEFAFEGKSSHAAGAPWDGKNALNGVQLMFHAFDMLRQHVRPDVRIHGIIKEGGDACNIVPENALGHLYIRANERSYLDSVREMIYDCAKGAAVATQTCVEINKLCPSMKDLKANKSGEELMEVCFQALGLKDQSEEIRMGSSDAGNMSYYCPTLHPTLALAPENVSLHTKEFTEYIKGESAYQAILKGAKLLCMASLRFFQTPGLADKIKRDFSR